MSQSTLLRYNFRVLMLNNWWLLAFPVAVSQLAIFWNVITQRFSPTIPSQTVEMVTPLLAAFLGAHLLSAEYRSRIGAVLASRPVNIGKIVVMRLVVMLALVWGLAALALLAYYFWMSPYDLMPVVVACIPSTLFMTMLALTFATLFRNSLAGFGVAAFYWALQLPPGAPLHPYMSLQSLTLHYATISDYTRQAFVSDWWIAKVVLSVAAVLLYVYHARLVFTLGSSHTTRTRRRALAGAAAVVVLYLISGAFLKVRYGYANRGHLPPDDVTWFRYQFAPYGPIPVASLFGPAFTRYLGEFNNPWRLQYEESDSLGDTPKHRNDLRSVMQEMPDSMWAPSAADALARLEARRQTSVEATVSYFDNIVKKYPQSPYAEFALRQVARSYADGSREDDARNIYSQLLERYPRTVYRSEATHFLVDAERRAGRLTEARKWAEEWAQAASVPEKFEALAVLADLRKESGDIAGAKHAAKEALAAVEVFRKAMITKTLNITPTQELTRAEAANRAEQAAKALL